MAYLVPENLFCEFDRHKLYQYLTSHSPLLFKGTAIKNSVLVIVPKFLISSEDGWDFVLPTFLA